MTDIEQEARAEAERADAQAQVVWGAIADALGRLGYELGSQEETEEFVDDLPRLVPPPATSEAERIAHLEDVIEKVREAWWSATEQGDTGVVYTDRIEDAMDAIWDAAGHANWTPGDIRERSE